MSPVSHESNPTTELSRLLKLMTKERSQFTLDAFNQNRQKGQVVPIKQAACRKESTGPSWMHTTKTETQPKLFDTVQAFVVNIF